MDWIQSVQRSLRYIEAHLLDEELDNDDVAKNVFSSNANFQRIFILIPIQNIDKIQSRPVTLLIHSLVKELQVSHNL